MENKTTAIKQLQQRMDEIEPLKDKTRFGSDFTHWYKKAITTIEDIFGKNSEEIKDFKSIKLEPPEALLPEVLLESIKTVAHEDIEILNNREQRYYEERLSELREFLLAWIVKLRNE